ncbi:MAG: SAF domain-containing protein [Acidimicrobiia bacterium]
MLERTTSPSRERVPVGSARISARARGRLGLGALIVAVGVLLNLAIYRGVNDRSPVLQLDRDVPAGEQITVDDFRVVDIGSDDSFRAVPSGELNAVVGTYAKVRLVAGALLARETLQAAPLVAAGASVIAMTVPAGEVPIGLRERSRINVVIIGSDRTSTSVAGLVVGLPTKAAATGQVSVSIELAVPDASSVAAAEKVRLVLLDPGAAE